MPRKKRFKWSPGRCYESAGKYVWKIEPSGIIVHGIARLKADDGTLGPSGHAWVEVERGPDTYCIDGYTQVFGGEMIASEYYDRRQAEPIARFTYEESCRLFIKTSGWGPWRREDLGDDHR